jgi:transcriptional regulator with PAS, ATPase and Fis domain
MSDELKNQVKNLRRTIFNMLNYANMYVLVLDEKMEVRFANSSLALDLGFNNYKELVGRCWLDFIKEEERKTVITIHKVISVGEEWEKYKEFQNTIVGKEEIYVHWFNSHINSDYNWTFSFGIRKKPPTQITMTSIRNYYKDIIDKDRTMIDSMRDMIVFRDRVVDSCQPKFDVENNNEGSISV